MQTDHEKLLALIEERFYAFGKRIADFENQREQIKKIQSQIDTFSVDLSAFVANFQTVFAENKQNYEIFSHKHKNVSQDLDQVFKKICELQKHVDTIYKNHSVVDQSLASNKNSLESQYEKIHASEYDISNLSKKVKVLEALNDRTHDSFLVVERELHHLNDHKQSIKSIIDEMKSQHINHKNDLKDVSEEIKKTEINVLEKIEIFSEFYRNKISDVYESIQNKFSSIRIPDISGFIVKKDLDQMRHLIDLSALDAKNAFLKSNNIEMQQQILSKKVDGIQISIKSQEYKQ